MNDNVSIGNDVIVLFGLSHVQQIGSDNFVLALLAVLTGRDASLANICRLVQIEGGGSVGGVISKKLKFCRFCDPKTSFQIETFGFVEHILHHLSHCLSQLCLVVWVGNCWNSCRIKQSYNIFRGSRGRLYSWNKLVSIRLIFVFEIVGDLLTDHYVGI